MDKYGIIGFPLEHTFSPQIHNPAFEKLRIDASYDTILINPEFFDREILKLKASDYKGFNITIPYKQKIIRYIDEVDPLAQKINAVNTIVKKGEKWVGYNTDPYGFIMPIAETVKTLRSVLVIGAGGAAHAVCFSLLQYSNIKLLTIINRSMDKAKALKEKFKQLYNIKVEAGSLHFKSNKHFDLIVNTTNVGMGSLIDKNPFHIAENHHPKSIVYDLIYNPAQTLFLKEAVERDLAVLNGLEMLIGQAMKSFQIWTGEVYPKKILNREIFYRKG